MSKEFRRVLLLVIKKKSILLYHDRSINAARDFLIGPAVDRRRLFHHRAFQTPQTKHATAPNPP